MKKKRSRKETYAQKVVGLAAVGLPAPVQSVAKSRWGSRLVVLVVPILVATGVLTVTWNGWVPSFSVNRERAAVVGEDIKSEAIKAAERLRDYGDPGYR